MGVYLCALRLFTTGGFMPTFRIQVSETYNKEFIVECPDRLAAESVAASILTGITLDPKLVTKPVLLTGDQKNSQCAIQQEPDGIYDETAQFALHAS